MVRFPPSPLMEDLFAQMINGFCEDINKDKFLKSACVVCGQLCLTSTFSTLSDCDIDLRILMPTTKAMTRKERGSIQDPIAELKGPVILPTCDHVCAECLRDLEKGSLSTDALANDLWIGEIPFQLRDLTWCEKMLTSRVKHNYCIIQVKVSGMWKMCANAICHSVPMPKIY
ncbi:uncharacterized protein LAESUDRAFT_657237 [Laetiporus sulphureus 93-53]|uniref:DUF6570 domain-containing protein n=1 Tax=Laetiporus sulphureus 93-53 TaxID=1314785 RepID=A0A165DEQ4_9APHY|nr:uncharacterized protein LAESUDRAFT_657237 [Laetiporus sulphureus 93-53]KZT04723.1 hypothetical protein LAESUDRAFT_657237 [Laetiporus sulphureus 93-53]